MNIVTACGARTHGSICTAPKCFTVVFQNNTATFTVTVYCLQACSYADADWLSSSVSQKVARSQFCFRPARAGLCTQRSQSVLLLRHDCSQHWILRRPTQSRLMQFVRPGACLVLVALSSRARILGECSTIRENVRQFVSRLRLFFFFF